MMHAFLSSVFLNLSVTEVLGEVLQLEMLSSSVSLFTGSFFIIQKGYDS